MQFYESLINSDSEEDEYEHSNNSTAYVEEMKSRMGDEIFDTECGSNVQSIPCRSPTREHDKEPVLPYVNLPPVLHRVQRIARECTRAVPSVKNVLRHRIFRECVQIGLMNGVANNEFGLFIMRSECEILKLFGMEPCSASCYNTLFTATGKGFRTHKETFLKEMSLNNYTNRRFLQEGVTRYTFEYYRVRTEQKFTYLLIDFSMIYFQNVYSSTKLKKIPLYNVPLGCFHCAPENVQRLEEDYGG